MERPEILDGGLPLFFFSSRRRHTRCLSDWSSDVCSSDLGARPFLVGMVHGMAGSAALTLLVLATIPSALAGLIYIAVFGLGSVGGMLIMSSLISLPFVFAQKYFKVLGEAMQLIVGLSSVAFGFLMAWQIGLQQI